MSRRNAGCNAAYTAPPSVWQEHRIDQGIILFRIISYKSKIAIRIFPCASPFICRAITRLYGRPLALTLFPRFFPYVCKITPGTPSRKTSLAVLSLSSCEKAVSGQMGINFSHCPSSVKTQPSFSRLAATFVWSTHATPSGIRTPNFSPSAYSR